MTTTNKTYSHFYCSIPLILLSLVATVGCGEQSSPEIVKPEDVSAEPVVPYESKLENLREALMEGTVDDIRYFIANGDDFEKEYDKDWSQLLLTAVDNPRVDVFKYLIEQGADVNVKFEPEPRPFYTPRTVLHGVTAVNPNPDVVEFLIEKGAKVNAVDDEGMTPLHFAARNSDVDFLECLIQNGADVNATDNDGRTLLHHASRSTNANVATLKCLVAQGADINAKDYHDRTLLHEATLNSELDIYLLRYLVSEGLDVNAQDFDGMTPLHLLAYTAPVIKGYWDRVLSPGSFISQGVDDLMQYLIDKGADVSAKDKYGGTPLHQMAQGRAPTESIRSLIDARDALIKNGADINAKNNFGRTPLDYATNENIKTILREAGGKTGKELKERTTSQDDATDK